VIKCVESIPVKQWYVYILENQRQQFYTGITTDPKRRLRQHNGIIAGGAKALRGKGPVFYRSIFLAESQQQALKMEAWIKKCTRSQKAMIIQGHPPGDFICQRLSQQLISQYECH
jgi:putative endonuclease